MSGMNTSITGRLLSLGSAFALTACSSTGRESGLTSWTPEQREVYRACQSAAANSREASAVQDRRKTRETGVSVGGAYAKGALETWDPVLQVASLGLGAAFGGAAALADGVLRGARRHEAAQEALRACLTHRGPAPAEADGPPQHAGPHPSSDME